jgi:hypothetical protein
MDSYTIKQAPACPMATVITNEPDRIYEIQNIIKNGTVVKEGDDIHTWIEVNVRKNKTNMNTFKLMTQSTMPNVCLH